MTHGRDHFGVFGREFNRPYMPAHSSDSQGQPRGKRPVRRVGHEVYQLILFQKQVCGTVCTFNWHTFQKDLHTGCRNTANKVTAYIAKATKITNTVEMMTSWLEKILSLDMNHSTGKKPGIYTIAEIQISQTLQSSYIRVVICLVGWLSSHF